MAYFSKIIQILVFIYCASPTTPYQPKLIWFGLFHVRSPLLMESLIVFFSSGYLDVSVPQVSFPTITRDTLQKVRWVAPFRNLRITLCKPIPATYRSLPRLSSPLRAKAFSIRPYIISYLLLKLEYGKSPKKEDLPTPILLLQ